MLAITDRPETPSQVDDEDARFWLAEIEAAKQRLEKWYDKADEAIERYKDNKSRAFGWLNILWANVETQKAALGEDFGKPDVVRSNAPDDDGLTRHISLVWQNAIDAAVTCDGDNHEIKLAVHDVLLPGRGQVWLELNPQLDELGQVSWVEAPLMRVPYRDYLEGPAQSWKSVPWVGRAHLFTLDDLIDKFPYDPEDPDSVDPRDIPRNFSLPMPDGKNAKTWCDDNKGKEQFKRARVWEIWAKFPNKRRIYVAEDFSTATLRVDDDPYRLRGFFPCPRPLLANADEGWQQPLTDYSRYEDQALELDRVSERIYVQTEVLKRRGVYNKRFKELADLPMASDNQLIPVDDWTSLAQAGGLQTQVQWEDLAPTVSMLDQLHSQRDNLITLIYQLTGISDLARGQTDPNETLGAQKLKMAFGSGRFAARQTESRRFAADAYAIKGELIAEHFPKAQIEDMAGIALPLQGEIDQAQQMLQALQQRAMMAQQSGIQFPPPPKQLLTGLNQAASAKFSWEQVSGVLQSDRRRSYRVGVETDQTQFRDEEADKQARIEFMGAITNLLETFVPVIKASPETGDIAKQLIMFALRGFSVGRAMEEGIETALDALIEEAKNTPPDQQPNAELVAAQAMAQDSQTKLLQVQSSAQLAAQKAAIDKQKSDIEAMLTEQKQRADYMAQISKLQAQIQAQNQDTTLKQATLASENALKQAQFEHDRQMEMLDLELKREQVLLSKLDIALKGKQLDLQGQEMGLKQQDTTARIQDMQARRTLDANSAENVLGQRAAQIASSMSQDREAALVSSIENAVAAANQAIADQFAQHQAGAAQESGQIKQALIALAHHISRPKQLVIDPETGRPVGVKYGDAEAPADIQSAVQRLAAERKFARGENGRLVGIS